MTKTPDEIKKGLECCHEMCSRGNCPYREDPECTISARKDALALIQQLEAQVPRWIPVEERMPECADEDVLVIVNGEHGITTFYDAYMLAKYYPGEGWIIDGYEDWETPNVSFWMPLPEPPKEEPPC